VALVATIVIAPFGLQNWLWPVHPIDWVAMGLMGAAGYTRYRRCTSPGGGFHPCLLFTYSRWSKWGSSWLTFNQAPDWPFYVDITIIVAGGLVV
jgi:hypothetical protein